MFRMTKGKLCKNKKKYPPVLLMHGLFESSDVFLAAGPDAGMVYLLADACYDVWIGNTRGNYYGRKHTRLDPDSDEEFWDFTAEEIGTYDLPAKIDYILKSTGSDKVNYIGFSQGGGIVFIMCSERPEYCGILGVVVALAPAVRLDNSQSKFFGFLLSSIMTLKDVLNYLGIYEIFPKDGVLQSLGEIICDSEGNIFKNIICENVFILLDTERTGTYDDKTLRIAHRHFPAGTSIKNMLRYKQLANTGLFRKYDYGAVKNIEKYATVEPPIYNLTSIKTPVVILHGLNDHLVDIKDIKWTVNELNNAELFVVEDPSWNHFDWVYNKNVKEKMFAKINEYLLKYSVKYMH